MQFGIHFISIFCFLIEINIIHLGANYIQRMNMCRQLSSMRQVCMICCQNHYYSVYVNISIIMVISAARCAANFKFYGNHLRVLLRFLSINASCYTSKLHRVINRNNQESSKLKAYLQNNNRKVYRYYAVYNLINPLIIQTFFIHQNIINKKLLLHFYTDVLFMADEGVASLDHKIDNHL